MTPKSIPNEKIENRIRNSARRQWWKIVQKVVRILAAKPHKTKLGNSEISSTLEPTKNRVDEAKNNILKKWEQSHR